MFLISNNYCKFAKEHIKISRPAKKDTSKWNFLYKKVVESGKMCENPVTLMLHQSLYV